MDKFMTNGKHKRSSRVFQIVPKVTLLFKIQLYYYCGE